ncbi:MAG: tetrahydromethanopterin S-methyltransferase subunit A [Euryarchaeota archaeon]|nr:tetrahydromethanopterin S-methyltransferase subunit A [Euryarchaeota archaeon]
MFEDTIAKDWPFVRGDYTVVDPLSHICVVTLASDMNPLENVCMIGSCKTENLGIEKIIANTITNVNIRYILICGQESRGHLSGNTLLAVYKNGIDDNGRIIGSEGAIPFIENIPVHAVERFRQQVELIDLRGLVDTQKIQAIVEEYRSKGEPFSQPPLILEFTKKKKRHSVQQEITHGDMMIASDILMDSVSGVIFTEE